MNLRKFLVPLGVVGVIVLGYTTYGWAGLAAVAGGLVMWALLHFTRVMNVMQKAAKRPIGYVGSAVMLNARLAQGVNLMHVMAMTQAMGEALSAEGEEPEIYRWTDGTGSHVTCEFRHGKLATWTLVRPPAQAGAQGAQEPPAAP